MIYYKTFCNGLRLVVNEMAGFKSVSTGVLVGTGSNDENCKSNGISHFIEHMLFKGTQKRTAFEISDYVDGLGATINAYTSKMMTAYYVKSIGEHFKETLEVLADMFFNSTFEEDCLEKEKGVVKEEIKMNDDTPEDVCLDLLAKARFGRRGAGRTILGSAKNVSSFTKEDIKEYMQKRYTADNVVISVAGAIKYDEAVSAVEKYFADGFKTLRKERVKRKIEIKSDNLYAYKNVNQSHFALSFSSLNLSDGRSDILAIANDVLGGGMSSRLFQTIREEMGLAYSVYSYNSPYLDCGHTVIYAGVNALNRDEAAETVMKEVDKFCKEGVTQREFERSREQLKSSVLMGMENTTTTMIAHGKQLLLLNKEYDEEKRVKEIMDYSLSSVNELIKETFDFKNGVAAATVGKNRTPIKI